MQRSRGRGHSGTHRRGATRPPTSSPGSCQEACAAKPEEPADLTLLDALKGQRERVARLVDAVAETGGSAALTARLKDEEAKSHWVSLVPTPHLAFVGSYGGTKNARPT